MERSKDITKNTKSDDLEVVASTDDINNFANDKTISESTPKSKTKKLEASTDLMIDKPKKFPKLRKLWSKTWFKVTTILLLTFLVLTSWTTVVGYSVYGELLVASDHVNSTKEAFSSRDLQATRDNLNKTNESIKSAHSKFNKTSFYKYVPVLKGYWNDVNHVFTAGQYSIDTVNLVLDSIEPYADVIGFTGATTQQIAKSAEDRIVFIAETVEKLAPEMDNIAASLNKVNDEVAQINEKRYPKSLNGYNIREQITDSKHLLSSTSTSLTQFQPIIELLPDLLGNPDPKTYLLLFQNDAELRPTGGFMTAYATLEINKGKFTAGVSQDIYTLDNNFKRNVPAPEPIKKYLPLVYYWNLRDMNLSPDFKVSMDTFTKYYKEVPGAPEVDGIIAIDTQVPVRLLEVLGPIGVSGYGGKFSAENDPRCDCPQVIYALENIITRPTYEIREGRKSILGPLMQSMMGNMMGSPKSKWPEFFNVFTESVNEKHLLMYFFDEDRQKAVESLQAAGRIVDYEGDYLHINDTNFAGAKSNLFIESEVIQDIQISSDGTITKKITITYRNPAPADNCNLEAGQLCLNGLLRDWIRIYVPKGSKLIGSKGSEVDVIETEDLNKTVFEGFFTIAPESVKKLEFEYEVPSQGSGDYRLLIQNQPGTKSVPHTITLGNIEKIIDVNSDTEVLISR